MISWVGMDISIILIGISQREKRTWVSYFRHLHRMNGVGYCINLLSAHMRASWTQPVFNGYIESAAGLRALQIYIYTYISVAFSPPIYLWRAANFHN